MIARDVRVKIEPDAPDPVVVGAARPDEAQRHALAELVEARRDRHRMAEGVPDVGRRRGPPPR